ncbi:hypothetical protein FJV46_13355 [Arthrobacter agilis]|uniref:hypothetical protein n=1 Tax=Arthrobacter agilis TaxID=37921 RepID=UPI000B57B736|nr:hypothetical protein [Arthrobacter agilis]OUM45675.1 hypothetical protein B8W74_00190 [Arthrobacter agilis]PPB47775.1 hypothetical protein CI784_00190 [Arthrobacter agilis]TPV22458.1 hypothetical protein FJV46_13355 [Arthrobacter agilis]
MNLERFRLIRRTRRFCGVLLRDRLTDSFFSCIGLSPTAPSAVATILEADDGARSVYNDPAVLRAGDSGQTHTGTLAPAPEIDLADFFDPGGADGDGE